MEITQKKSFVANTKDIKEAFSKFEELEKKESVETVFMTATKSKAGFGAQLKWTENAEAAEKAGKAKK